MLRFPFRGRARRSARESIVVKLPPEQPAAEARHQEQQGCPGDRANNRPGLGMLPVVRFGKPSEEQAAQDRSQGRQQNEAEDDQQRRGFGTLATLPLRDGLAGILPDDLAKTDKISAATAERRGADEAE